VNQSGSYRDVTDTTVVAQFKVLGRQENYYVRSFMITSVQKNLQHYKLSVLDLDEFISCLDNNAVDFAIEYS
jgi:isoleucyl-tRNA synthetase